MCNLEELFKTGKALGVHVLFRTDQSMGYFLHVFKKDSAGSINSLYKGYSHNLLLLMKNGIDTLMEVQCK